MSRPFSAPGIAAGAALVMAGCLSLSVATVDAAGRGGGGQGSHPTSPAANGSGNGSANANGSGTGAARNGHQQPGDANRGDVWLDNVGQPAGPGHEMDPHLACADINLWGARLADPSGTYSIDGWPPTGSKQVDYASTWHYDLSAGGTQVIDTIPIATLIANATANGDAPRNGNGFHFKLDLSQDPQKHKVFWVDCPAPASAPTHSGGPGTGPTGGAEAATTPGGGAGAAAAVAPVSGVNASQAPATSAAAAPATAPSGGVEALSVAAPATTPHGGVEAAVSPSSTPLTGAHLPLLLSGLLILLGLGTVLVSRRMRATA